MNTETAVTEKYEFGYWVGQLAYYLLWQSETENKTHGLVEPFMNIKSVKMLFRRLEELFQNYKHKIWLGNKGFNQLFSRVAEFVSLHKEDEFDDEMKAGFYAGYFDDNPLLEKKSKEEGESNE